MTKRKLPRLIDKCCHCPFRHILHNRPFCGRSGQFLSFDERAKDASIPEWCELEEVRDTDADPSIVVDTALKEVP